MNVTISSIKIKKKLKEWRRMFSGCVEKIWHIQVSDCFKKPKHEEFLKIQSGCGLWADSWPSITAIILACSSNEEVGLLPSATDCFLQRFNHSLQVLSLLSAFLWPLLPWSVFPPPQHTQNHVLSALLERRVPKWFFAQMWALPHSWRELCVLLHTRIRLQICELCCACLTVSGDGALFAYN